jgi:hypothetical protein
MEGREVGREGGGGLAGSGEGMATGSGWRGMEGTTGERLTAGIAGVHREQLGIGRGAGIGGLKGSGWRGIGWLGGFGAAGAGIGQDEMAVGDSNENP